MLAAHQRVVRQIFREVAKTLWGSLRTLQANPQKNATDRTGRSRFGFR